MFSFSQSLFVQIWESRKCETLPPFRELGFPQQAVSFESRSQIFHREWQPHLDEVTKNLRRFQAKHQAKKVVLWGCGALAETPPDLLAELFQKVYLVDACFTRKTLQKVNALQSKALECHYLIGDVSFSLESIFELQVGSKNLFEKIHQFDADLHISPNVLSQLPILPLLHFQKRFPDATENESRQFAASLVNRHIANLREFGKPVLIWTDRKRRQANGEESLTLIDAPLPDPRGKWDWQITPAMTLVEELYEL